jgi:UDP-GlcNAc:undecaprenyl-phosphate/decaprenyl-phosphate GlcNAc-1-phosphate transferase
VRVLVGLVAGVVGGAVGWRLMAPTLGAPVLQRKNHRGAAVATAGGLVVVVAAMAVEGIWAVVGDGHALVLAAALGYGFLGLVDDVIGSGEDGRGFGGHLRALVGGRLTTGGMKLAGGAAPAVALSRVEDGDRLGRLVADAALVALSANLANLFDRAPGRVLKVASVALGVLVAVSLADPELAGVAVVVGAALALGPADLSERVMLGDTGANVLGAVLGLGAVLALSPGARVGALVVVAALNLASEVVSFSAVIDRVAPLRAADRWGRRG